MFKRITELEIGDEIYITNLWETLVYKVVETKVIDLIDSQNIYIKTGRSLVTLSTCHPYPRIISGIWYIPSLSRIRLFSKINL